MTKPFGVRAKGRVKLRYVDCVEKDVLVLKRKTKTSDISDLKGTT